MKAALVCAVLVVCVAVSYASLTCFGDEEKCGPDECCVRFGPVGRCRPLLEEGKICEMKPAQHILKKHVYLYSCPCVKGMKCQSSKGGLVGKFLGKCQPTSDEDGGDGDGDGEE